MAVMRMPRILSPNLGCPEILSLETLENEGACIVVAFRKGQWDSTQYQLRAVPSYAGEGRGFPLALLEPRLLDGEELPQSFLDVSETRWLISRTLRASFFKNQAQFWRFRIRPTEQLGLNNLREAQGARRSTLFDLVLYRGGDALCEVKHSLCLRPPSPEVRFIHLTDLHVAARNDIWESEVNSTVNPERAEPSPLEFINFNDRLRCFIREANALSDAGKLDFVLALGDLVDFVRYGFEKDGPLDNNWRVLIDILTGGGEEANRGNQGLRVPVFTTLGNHDWRPYPYPPEFNPQIFGLKKKDLEKFDYLYSDTDDTVAAKISEVHSELVSKGSPILARSWWGRVAGRVIRATQIKWDKFWRDSLAPTDKELQSSFVKFLSTLLGLAGVGGGILKPELALRLLRYLFPGGSTLHALRVALGEFFVLVVGVLLLSALLQQLAKNRIYALLREVITALIGIESDVGGLRDYFLNVNPYFNYAFRLENCYFLILDTGHDALTAQSFWDNGGKKLQHLKVRDNIIGGSPETVAFRPANECYPYSQIAWLELVLDCIRRPHDQLVGAGRRCRVFVGLHAPPANLSTKDRAKVDALLRRRGRPVLLRRGWPGGFDIRYGTLNHYLSQFFYLCLGYRQSARATPSGPGIDVVLAGHVHWNMEFRLERPAGAAPPGWHPQVYYGDFSPEIEHNQSQPNRWWGTLLLQTAACGPPSVTQPHTPNFRYITVTQDLGVTTLRPQHLLCVRSSTSQGRATPHQTAGKEEKLLPPDA